MEGTTTKWVIGIYNYRQIGKRSADHLQTGKNRSREGFFGWSTPSRSALIGCATFLRSPFGRRALIVNYSSGILKEESKEQTRNEN